MQPQKPSVATTNLQQHTSVAKVLAGNVAMAQPVAWDGSNIPTRFDQDNQTGNIFRVVFPSANTNTNITHNLNRIPIGYIMVRSDRACILYDGTIAGWTETHIVLKCTVASADTSIYVF